MNEIVLSVRNLHVEFRTQKGVVQAVRGVDFDVKAGETLGVVGESGAGKSVSFLALLDLLPRTARVSGSATLNGVDLIGASRRQLRAIRGSRIAMIFQDPLSALNPVHRVGDQIVEMIRAHQDLGAAEAGKRAVELLDLVGIPQSRDRARQYPHEFSGGMRQRVMIAMAIANNPRILIADEPTTALDVTVQAQILELIAELQKELQMAVVMITHDLGVIAHVADRVQVMYAGRVVEENEVGAIFSAPRHPYTEGLLQSLPRVGQSTLTPIAGSPPNMLQPPPGCAFAARCRLADDRCRLEVPQLEVIGSGMSACFKAAHLDRESSHG